MLLKPTQIERDPRPRGMAGQAAHPGERDGGGEGRPSPRIRKAAAARGVVATGRRRHRDCARLQIQAVSHKSSRRGRRVRA